MAGGLKGPVALHCFHWYISYTDIKAPSVSRLSVAGTGASSAHSLTPTPSKSLVSTREVSAKMNSRSKMSILNCDESWAESSICRIEWPLRSTKRSEALVSTSQLSFERSRHCLRMKLAVYVDLLVLTQGQLVHGHELPSNSSGLQPMEKSGSQAARIDAGRLHDGNETFVDD